MQAIEYSNNPNAKVDYQLEQDFSFTADIHVNAPDNNSNPALKINRRGQLTIQKGYGFNNTRATFGAKSTVRASLIYNALCELMAQSVIPKDQKDKINEILVRIAMEDGLLPLMSIPVFWAQQLLGRNDGQS
ncbi:MAG: hypothetical protein HRU20_30880 [Pseudomonadales bacterium]|nr:hypothetical protein [Pseudomonadales bacterium]